MNLSKIWRINNRPVIAPTVEDAIATYKAYYLKELKTVVDVTEVTQVIFDDWQEGIISNSIIEQDEC